VVLLTGSGVRAVTAEGEWHASVGSAADGPATGERATGRRDALVAGFVPGIALGWTWPDMLRHALALADSVTPDGEADLALYEKLLPEVKLTGPRG
jgi:fructose-1-phosphate kinase PfkB-like protein